MIWLDDGFAVAPQIGAEDLEAIAAAGVRRVVNNRPDGEEAGQPDDATLMAAATAAGLDWRAIPVAGGFGRDQVDAMADSLGGEGPVLAFCRSGTRSAYLWALARAAGGADPDALSAKARAGGYDLSPVRPLLDRLYSSSSASSS